MGALGGAMAGIAATIFDTIMKSIWIASLQLLRAAFGLVDVVTAAPIAFDGSTPTSPGLAAVWTTMRSVAVAIALGLFFWQLGSMVLRGGRGFFRTVTGPIAYGIALAVTGGFVAALLGAADELTRQVLGRGFHNATSFAGLLDDPTFHGLFTAAGAGHAVLDGVSATVLGLTAIFGVVPASLGYLGEMVFRQAATFVLIATVPVLAAGLVAQVSNSWFWRGLRWMLAAILIKPALAVVLVIGVSLLDNPTGIGALLAGIGVLLIALMCPFALFRLLAFVEPGTNAGAASRAWASDLLASFSPGGGGAVDTSSGTDSAEAGNTARFDDAAPPPAAPGAGSSGGGSGSGGNLLGRLGSSVDTGAAWSANFANAQMDATGVGSPGGGTMPAPSAGSTGGSGGGNGQGASDGGGAGADEAATSSGAGQDQPTPATTGGGGSAGASSGMATGAGAMADPPVPTPPGRDGGPDRPAPDHGAGPGGAPTPGRAAGEGGEAGGIADAAVIV